jgi:4-amino-4-deoxychorismate lyase
MVALTLVDGVLTDTVPVSDRGLLYGDGVFETIRYSRQQLLLLPAHLERLQQSCTQLGIALVPGEIQGYVDALLTRLSFTPAPTPASAAGVPQDGVVKIIVTRGDGGRGYAPPASAVSRCLVQFHPLPKHYAEYARGGISCLMCSHPVSSNPALAGLKHLNRLDQVMASRELVAAQNSAHYADSMLQEGLMCDSQGNLVEGTRSNVFAIIDGVLCTPDLSEAGVSGIMRSALLDWYREQGTAVAVKRFSAAELSLASELFICNSVLGVWPVNRVYDLVEGTTFNLLDQTMARRAQQWLLTHK